MKPPAEPPCNAGDRIGIMPGLMLKHLRNKRTQKKIYLGLAILIIPSFVLVGIFSAGDQPSTPLGFIGGESVSLQEYLSSYRAATHQAQFVYGDNFDQVKRFLNFKGEAWDRLLLLEHAEKEKIRVSDAEVVRWITGQNLFNRGGSFDDAYYKNYVTRFLQIRERDFEEEIREMLTLSKLRDRLKASDPPTEDAVRQAYDRRFGEKSLAYGFIPWEAMKDKAKVEDADIEKIYPIVKDRLTAPGKSRFRFVAVPKAKAGDAKAQATLDAAAKAAGVTVQETPLFSKDDSPPAGFPQSPEVLVAAFALGAGEESAWIDLDDASYKVEAVEKTPERALSLEESKETIRQLLVRQSASKEAVERLKALKERLEKEDFEKVLNEEKIEVRTLERYKAGDALPAFGESEQVEPAVAALKEGAVSEPFQGPAGAAIVKVTQEKPADAKAYEEEKEKFRETFAEERADAKMQELVERLRQDLRVDAEMLEKIFGPAEESPSPAPAG